MQTNSPIKLEINERLWIIATFADGHNMVYGETKTLIGAKRRLAFHAKRLGLTVNGNKAA